jgi:hypothetical protein
VRKLIMPKFLGTTTYFSGGILGGGVFIGVKNYVDYRELWADEDFELMVIGMKVRNTKSTWETVGIYRAPNCPYITKDIVLTSLRTSQQ